MDYTMRFTFTQFVLSEAAKPHITISGGEDGNRGIALLILAIGVAAVFLAGFYIGRKTANKHRAR